MPRCTCVCANTEMELGHGLTRVQGVGAEGMLSRTRLRRHWIPKSSVSACMVRDCVKKAGHPPTPQPLLSSCTHKHTYVCTQIFASHKYARRDMAAMRPGGWAACGLSGDGDHVTPLWDCALKVSALLSPHPPCPTHAHAPTHRVARARTHTHARTHTPPPLP